MSYLKSMGTSFIYICLFLAFITFVPGFPPDTEFREYSIVPPRSLDPKIGPKNRLHGAQKLYTGEIVGAESFETCKGELYSGIHDGYVVKLEEDRVVPIVKFGEKCDGIWQEHKCGRPLGIKCDDKGNLYVIDAYYGIFKVDVATRKYKRIIDITKPIEGKIPRLPNSIDIAKNGDLYWTVSDSDFHLYDGVYTFFNNPSGRLMRYNAAEKRNEVLLENLAFANGLKLSDDESFVIVAECVASRIIKYNLKGPKAGQKEIFIEGFQGLLDNIHSDGHGGFFVTSVLHVDAEHPQLFQSLMPHPNIRKMLVRLLLIMEAPFKLLNDIYPNTFAQRLVHAIGSFQSIHFLDTVKKSVIFRIDANGNIIDAVSSDDDDIFSISSAYIYKDHLWLGSPWLNYVPRVPLKQAFPDLANNQKQSSNTDNDKALPKDNASDLKSERLKRDTESASTTAPKPTSVPRTPKSIDDSVISESIPTVTTSKPIVASTTTSKPHAASKQSPTIDKSSDTKQKLDIKSAPIDDKMKNTPKSNTNTPNAKIETDDKLKDNVMRSNKKSEKNIKENQEVPAKQKERKFESEKVKPKKVNLPKDADK